MQGWCRGIILAFLCESSDRRGRSGRVRLVEAAIVSLDKCVTACSVGVIAYTEGLRLASGSRNDTTVIILECIGTGPTVNGT